MLVYDVAEDVIGSGLHVMYGGGGHWWAADGSWSQFGGAMLFVVPELGDVPAGHRSHPGSCRHAPALRRGGHADQGCTHFKVPTYELIVTRLAFVALIAFE
jgi:hypothetical protein